MKKSSLLRNHQARKPRQKAMLIRSRDWPAVTSSSNFTKAEWIKEEQPNTNKNSFRQQNKSSFTTGAKTNHQKENRRTFFYNFSPKLCVAHRLSPMQECVLVPHIACMFENMSKWGNHTFCFRNHLRCFKVQLTPCVKSTRATTTLAGLQFSTPRKDVTNKVPINVTADLHLASKISSDNSSKFKHSRTCHHLFHTGPEPETLRDTQTSNLAIPGQREWRGQTLGICRRQRRSYQMCPRWNGQFTVGERITYQDLYFVITILFKMFDYFFIISYIL